MRVRISFALKSAFAISLIVFIVVFGIINFIMNSFYSMVQNYTENMLKVINKGFKEDYYIYKIESIKRYGLEITENNLDEYKSFSNVIEPTLIGFADTHKVYEDNKTSHRKAEFVASAFYWDGKRLYSQDHSYQNEDFIQFLKNSSLKLNESYFYIDKYHSDVIFIYKLRQGIIGCCLHPETYNKVWLKSVFRGIPIDFYVSVSTTNKDSNIRFFKVVDELDGSSSKIDDIYNSLIKGVKNQDFDIVGQIRDDKINFLIVHNYGDFVLNGIMELPLRGIFPLTVLEISIFVSIPIVLLIFGVTLFFNNRVFRRIREVSGVMEELSRSGGDLSLRIQSSSEIGEVREVVENFNSFLDTIEDVVKKTKRTFRDIEENISILKEVEEEVGKVSGVVERQDEVRQMIEELSAMSREIGTTA
ncbi:MAG: HAMP domain-containing protein, partial [Brevinematales bacterium]|nr:HAMP domain-containing protein [Brevinematales bacterium]